MTNSNGTGNGNGFSRFRDHALRVLLGVALGSPWAGLALLYQRQVRAEEKIEAVRLDAATVQTHILYIRSTVERTEKKVDILMQERAR